MGDDGRCFDWAPRLHDHIKDRTSLRSFLEMKPWQIYLRGVRSHPLSRQNQNTICDLPFSFSSLQPFWRWRHSSQPTLRPAGSSSYKLQRLKVPILPSELVPTPFSNLKPTNSAPEMGLLGGRVRHGRLPSQGLVSADVLRECSQSRDAKLRAVGLLDGGESMQGRL